MILPEGGPPSDSPWLTAWLGQVSCKCFLNEVGGRKVGTNQDVEKNRHIMNV